MKMFLNKEFWLLFVGFTFACTQNVQGSTLAYGFGDWLRGGGEEWQSPQKQSRIAKLAEEARNGDVDAMRQMGIFSMRGQGVKPSARVAAQWLKKAAERGDSRSMMYLGDMYRKGMGVGKSNSRAMSYYADAYRRIEQESDTLIQGDKDNVLIKRIKKIPLSESLSWWKQRAEKGDVYAMYHLATLKQKERDGYLTKAQADKYMDMAAIHGHAKAIRTVEKEDPDKHLTYWADRAEKDDIEAWMKYAFALYKNGNCSEEEEREAIRYVEKAANRDHLEAKSWLADIYKKKMDKCSDCLLSGEHNQARRILDKLRRNEHFDATTLLESILTNKSASAESIQILKRYIPYKSSEAGKPIILLAVQNMQSVEVIQELRRMGYDVNAAHKETGETALIAAVKNCDVPVVQFLLQTSEIDVNRKDKTNKDALAYASDDKIRLLLNEAKARKERESAPQPIAERDSDAVPEVNPVPYEPVQKDAQPAAEMEQPIAIKKEEPGISIWGYLAGGVVGLLILGSVVLIVLKKNSSANKADTGSAGQDAYGVDDTLQSTPPPIPGSASPAIPPPFPQQSQPAAPPPPMPSPESLPPPPPWQQ